MIVADLFAGVGGLSQGFIKAGCKVAFAVEFDKEIAYAYKKNHPDTEVFAEDICQLDIDKIKQNHPKIDVVIGGPPCQGFSQKGKRLSLDDPRNFLFKQFVRFVAAFKPKYFVLENVPNIITTSNGFFKNQIIHMIGSHMKYSEWGVLVLPKMLEVIIINYADGMDADLEPAHTILKNAEKGKKYKIGNAPREYYKSLNKYYEEN